MKRQAHLPESRVQLFEGWCLTPEGAVIHAGEQTAVIADVHLGYEWARGAAGDCVIAHSLDETLGRLASLLRRGPIVRLIVAGDLVESPHPCLRTSGDIQRLEEWLAGRGVSLLLVEGNHDCSRRASASATMHTALPLAITIEIAGWMIGHGHKPLTGPRTISGHHHPVFRHKGTSAPCFLVGPGRIILPAFSANAAGCDVVTAKIPADWRASGLHCIVSTGCDLLDFGALPGLRRRLRQLAP
jgi:uncharacterized protein